ncbi:MAG: glycosyltransferase [Planctomycetota bacterium]
MVTTAASNPYVLLRDDWRGKPLLVQLHSVCNETHSIASKLKPHATHFVVTSHEAYDTAVTTFGIPRNQVTTIELAVDANRLASWAQPMELRSDFLKQGEHRLTEELVATAHWLLYFGRFAPEKRISQIAEAVKILNLRGKSWVGMFVGEGWKGVEIKASIRRTIPKNFILLPWIDNIGDVIRASDVFICASEYEGGPMASIEALLAGIPIVSTDVGILPSVKFLDPESKQQQHVYSSLGRNPTSLQIADVLVKAVGTRSPTERPAIASDLARRAAGRFNVRRMASDWLRVLQGILATRAGQVNQ